MRSGLPVTDPSSRVCCRFLVRPPERDAGGLHCELHRERRSTTFDNTGSSRFDPAHRSGSHQRTLVSLSGLKVHGGCAFPFFSLPCPTRTHPLSDWVVFNDTHTFRVPKLLTHFRFGWSRAIIPHHGAGFGVHAGRDYFSRMRTGKHCPGVFDGSQWILLTSGLLDDWCRRRVRSSVSTTICPQGRITTLNELFDHISLIAPFGASKHSLDGAITNAVRCEAILDGLGAGVVYFSSFTEFVRAGLVNTLRPRSRTGQSVALLDRYRFYIYFVGSVKCPKTT